MKTTLIVLAAALLCFVSCKNTEEVAKDDIEEKAAEVEFDPTGYTRGTIVYSKEENDCAYTIQLKDRHSYDPLNLEEEYKQDGLTVYFKFRSLRTKNRCPKAQPISIEEIIVSK